MRADIPKKMTVPAIAPRLLFPYPSLSSHRAASTHVLTLRPIGTDRSRDLRTGPVSRWVFWVRLGYVAVIGLATLSDLHFQNVGAAELARRLTNAMSPGVSAHDAVDGLRNLLLFAGWGLVWCMTAPEARLRRAIA